MFYINKHGDVIEAMQWDGSQESTIEISRKFGAKFYEICGNIQCEYKDGLLHNIESGDYVFRPFFGYGVDWKSKIAFETSFKSITEPRVSLAEQAKKAMLLKLEERQNKDDKWREETWEALMLALNVEGYELSRELRKIEFNESEASIEAAKKEAADVMNYAAMIHDKLQSMELDELWKSKEKIMKNEIFTDKELADSVRKCIAFIKKESTGEPVESANGLRNQNSFMVGCGKLMIEGALLFNSIDTKITLENKENIYTITIKKEEKTDKTREKDDSNI